MTDGQLYEMTIRHTSEIININTTDGQRFSFKLIPPPSKYIM